MAHEKKTKNTESVITGHLEKIGSNVFDDYSSIITGLIKGNQGIYALYKKDRLYYIGLASDLKRRINAHKRDKHQGKWTHFSLYIIRQEEHIKEIESFVLRISRPKGNSVKGNLKQSKDLRPLLKSKLKAELEKRFDEIIGGDRKKTILEAVRKIQSDKTDRPLKGYFKNCKAIYVTYKGKDYKALVYRNGRIKFNDKFYDSPSMAGIAVNKKETINGWKFWKYKNPNGELVYIDQLRK